MSAYLFSSLGLKPEILKNLSGLGYETMTDIQAASLPEILAGRDMIAKAKTGSGKTAAFGLGLLNALNVKSFRVQALVLCPTRELADQVAKEIRRLARAVHNIKVLTLCGGQPFGPQIGSLEHGAHIVVGTPGRVEEHLRKQNLKLGSLTHLVLDEADRMLDMGFQKSLDEILEYLPSKRQSLLFSATYPKEIEAISQRVLHNHTVIEVESRHTGDSIEQEFYYLNDGEKQRDEAVLAVLLNRRPESSVVFCRTKQGTEELADYLKSHGVLAVALHGDLDQRRRDQCLVMFANKSVPVLVATDVAARGLDIENLDAVINHELTRDFEVHVHRIGRTGRAGKSGFACSLFTEKERYKFESLCTFLKQEFYESSVPSIEGLQEHGYDPKTITIELDGGKKNKVRPGDILGALTGDKTLNGSEVGKIAIFDYCAYVAVNKECAKKALNRLKTGKLKGRSFRARQVRI